MSRSPLIFSMALAIVAIAAMPARAEREPRLGGDDGDYQLRPPQELTSPDELLGLEEDDDDLEDDEGYEEEDYDDEGDPEDGATEEGEDEVEAVSLELELEAAPEGEPTPVSPFEREPTERLRWLLIPPYYQGFRGEAGVRLFFPFYFQRWSEQGQRELAVVPFYYQSRGPAAEQAVDVAFPLFYWIRSAQSRTMVVGNVWWSRGEGSAHTGVAPLLAWGHTPQVSYQLVLPVFFRARWSEQREFWLAGLVFNHRFDAGYRRGLFPIFWMVENQGRGRMVAFPLLWHFWNRAESSSLTVVPPAYVQLFDDGFGFGVAPLLFVRRRASGTRATVVPLFHYRSEPNGDRTFASPLAWYRREGETTMGGVLLYHWMRGRESRFDAFLPFYLAGFNQQVGSRWRFIFPLVYTSESPVRRAVVLFPAVWDIEERFRSRTTAVLPFTVHHRRLDQNVHTTWVFPSFQYSRRLDGWDANLHPLLYLGRSGSDSHQVVFPVFWRFHRGQSTNTVAFPLWWDFASRGSHFQAFFPFYWHGSTPDGQWTAVLNFVYASGRRQGVPYWSMNVFPLFRVGRPAPGDIEWDVLLGMFGYGRRDSRRWVDLFWVPVELDRRGEAVGAAEGEAEPEEPAGAPSTPSDEPAELGREQDVGPRPAVALPELERRG